MLDRHKRIIFIDDSGDPGFKEASSRYFLMTAAVFDDFEMVSKVNRAISDFRISLGWSEGAEFKFSKTNKAIIRQLLELVSEFDFEIYSVYVDKFRYSDITSLLNKKKFYDWAIEELIKIIPFDEARVMVDGAADKNTRLCTSSYIRHKVNNNKRHIRGLKLVDSRRDNLIQLADLLSGALGRSLKSEKTDTRDYIRIIRKRIVKFQQITLDILA